MDRQRSSSLESVTNIALAGALLLFIAAVFNYFGASNAASPNQFPVVSSLAERNIALDQAKKNNQDSYGFTTSFIPGLGPAAGLTTPQPDEGG